MSRDGHDTVKNGRITTVIISFLERDRDRDFMNVSDRDLVQYERFRPFTVSDRS
jgi:hypothetical protein